MNDKRKYRNIGSCPELAGPWVTPKMKMANFVGGSNRVLLIKGSWEKVPTPRLSATMTPRVCCGLLKKKFVTFSSSTCFDFLVKKMHSKGHPNKLGLDLFHQRVSPVPFDLDSFIHQRGCPCARMVFLENLSFLSAH